MNPLDRSLILLTLIAVISILALTLVGEERPDVYLSITILVYFVYTSIDDQLRSKTRLQTLDAALFIVFAIVVTYRVLKILEII